MFQNSLVDRIIKLLPFWSNSILKCLNLGGVFM